MTTDTRHLKLSLEGRLLDRLDVVSFRGVEEANRPYRIEIDFTTDATDDHLQERLLDHGVSLSVLDSGEVVRAFHGIAGAVAVHGVFQHARRAYRLSLVPRLFRLKHRRTRRVWTDVSSLDVAATLFREHGVLHRIRVAEPPPKRPYCVQYDETDLAFLTRLLAEEGLFFTFDHPRQSGGSALMTGSGDAEVVVLGDTADFYVPIDGGEVLCFERSTPGSALIVRDDHVSYFAPTASLRTAAARARGYDMRRPTIDRRDEALHDRVASRSRSIAPALEPRTVTIFEGSYEDNIPVPMEGTTPSSTPRSAARLLDALSRKARVAEGASFCRRLCPGRTMVLRDHESPELDGGYVVTRVEHEAYGAHVAPSGRALYQNRFTVVPAKVPLRMRSRRRPRASTETAVVVGPAGQEVFTDDLGRVRVRFPWDLSGRPADQATAWARVAQSWAGAGWGAQFVPRCGMEVVVTYLDGDPDRPLITGAVYNATHLPPFRLPESAAQSGWRSQTTPGGEGANELRFDDRRGQELVFVQAQRDLTIVTGRDRQLQVAGDEKIDVRGAREERVGRDLRIAVEGSEIRSVDGGSRSTTRGDASRSILGSDAVHVAGARHLTVEGDLVERVDGSRFASVGEPGDTVFVDSSHVFGDRITSATGKVRIRADAGFVIECGDSKIEVTKEGIRLSGDKLVLAGREATSMTGKGPSLRLTDVLEMAAEKMRFFAKDAWVVLDKDVRMKGGVVKMNCDDEQPSTPEELASEVQKKPLKIKLSDAQFTAYGGRKFQLLVDGAVYEGTTTMDGVVEKEIPEDAESVQLVVWIGDYPTGEKRIWTLQMAPLPPGSDLRGAQMRLENLGYRSGQATGVLDPDTERAIAAFQSDSGLPPTGQLDGATAAKLTQVHGK